MTGEGFEPVHRAEELSTFEQHGHCDFDLLTLRLDYRRTFRFSFFNDEPTEFSEVLHRRTGAIVGAETRFVAPGFVHEGPLPTDRVASIWRQQELLNPHLLFAVARKEQANITAHSRGKKVRIVLPNDPASVELTIGDDDRVSEASTMENHPVLGDAEVRVRYDEWACVDDHWLPMLVELSLAGELAHREERSDVRVDPELPGSLFAHGHGDGSWDKDAWRWGRAHHQFHQRFPANGHPLVGAQRTVVASEIAPHVHHLTGGSHHTLVVDQGEHLVVLEAPLYVELGEAVLGWAGKRFPGVPVRYIVCMHHHDDHMGGLRAFVAAGAMVVCSRRARAYVESSLLAPRTIWPDRLAETKRRPVFEVVDEDRSTMLVGDAQRPKIQVLHMSRNSHSSDLLMAYVGDHRLLFHSDLYTPMPGPIPAGFRERAAELRVAVDAAELDVGTLAAGHGVGTCTYEEYLEKLSANVGAPNERLQKSRVAPELARRTTQH